MADQKISQLTQLTTILAGDMVPIVDNGQTYKAQSNDIVVQNIITGVLVTGGAYLTKIIGGNSNSTATGTFAVVVGGNTNASNSQYAFIGNGINNTIADNSNRSAILQGNGNQIGNLNAGTYGIVCGGSLNQANGSNVFIGNGVGNIATGAGSCIVNGSSNTTYGQYSSILCGIGLNNWGYASAIIAGDTNTLTGAWSIIGGGVSNQILPTPGSTAANYNFIGGGNTNLIKGNKIVIGGGRVNTVASDTSVCVGGDSNYITGSVGWSQILGGNTNSVYGDYSATVGNNTITSGDYQTAIGNYIQIPSVHTGAMVLADNTTTPKYSFSPLSLNLSFSSGVKFTGCDPILHVNYQLPAHSKVGGEMGTIKLSGNCLLICTGIASWGKIAITSY